MHPFDLEAAVAQQSWDWLSDISWRLDIGAEVIDDRGIPLLRPSSNPTAAAVRKLLNAPDAMLTEAIAHARDSAGSAAAAIDGLHLLCVRLSPQGMLLLAVARTEDRSAAECHQDLEFIGAWLTRAIEGSLANPPNTVSEEPYRVASLRRILSDAAASGSARRVLGAFVEALGVWDNVRIRVYAARADGGFFLLVSPLGTSPNSVPDRLDEGVASWNGRMVRLARTEADRYGFASEPGDVLMLPLVSEDEAGWLLVFSGTLDGAEQARLTFYADILAETLDAAFGTAANRLAAALPRHRLEPGERLDVAADSALQQLTAALAADAAALVVTTVTGIRALALGNASLLQSDGADDGIERLETTSSDTGSVMKVVMGRQHRPFTVFERNLLTAGASILHPMIQAALGPRIDIDRRRQSQPLEDVFDRLAATAVTAGQEASVIVASVDPQSVAPAKLQSWLGIIRNQLRTGDFAGMLSDREIVILLCDASADQAALVASRVKQAIAAEDGDGMFEQPTFSTITRSPESPFEGSLVGAARAGASALR